MKRKLKKELMLYFQAPVPKRKTKFIRSLEMPKLRLRDVLWSQVRYISKLVWLLSGCFFVASYWAGRFAEPRYLIAVFALIPFLVMLSVTECMRSCRYGMEELEQASRFSLKSVILTRMILLGLGNIILLILLSVVWGVFLQGISGWRCLLYLMSSYMLTASGGLVITRKMRGRECVPACFGFAVFVCGTELCLFSLFPAAFAPENEMYWLAAGIALAIVLGREVMRIVRLAQGMQCVREQNKAV